MGNMKNRVKKAVLMASTAGMTLIPTVMSYAADTGVDLASIAGDAIDQVKSDLTLVISLATAAVVGLVGITVGIAYLVKKLKGLKDVG